MSTPLVDESKVMDYAAVTALLVSSDEPTLRRDIRSLLTPGRARVDHTKESGDRRRATRLKLVGLQGRVFTNPTTRAAHGRKKRLNRLVIHAAQDAVGRVVLEVDESITHTDRRIGQSFTAKLRRSTGGC